MTPSGARSPRARLLLSVSLAALLAAPASGELCCQQQSCFDFPPGLCEPNGGIAGHCRPGEPCGAPSCDGARIEPVSEVKARKSAGFGDVRLDWPVDPNADRYHVWLVTDKRDLPANAGDTPVAGATPTTVNEAIHAGGVAGSGGTTVYYQVLADCGQLGACCSRSSTCRDDATQAACLAEGGHWPGPGSRCSAAPCPPRGACCGPFFCADGDTADECSLRGGVYGGDSSRCFDAPCALGACCLGAICLDQVSFEQCAQQGGFFQGPFSSCVLVGCFPAGGACCLPFGCIDLIPAFDCQAQGGRYLGDFSFCAPNACPPLGACCHPDSTCSDRQPETSCPVPGRFFADQTCAGAPCGNCCLAGTCEIVFEPFCSGMGGRPIECVPGTGC